jgi:hypothetical protein
MENILLLLATVLKNANSNTDIWVVDANNPNKDKKLTQVTRIVTILLLGVQMENISI